MVINVLDHVPHCYNAKDGDVIYLALKNAFAHEGRVVLSFSGVADVPSSFINAALVPFVLQYGPDWLRSRLSITSATGQVADMIRRCLINAERAPQAA